MSLAELRMVHKVARQPCPGMSVAFQTRSSRGSSWLWTTTWHGTSSSYRSMGTLLATVGPSRTLGIIAFSFADGMVAIAGLLLWWSITRGWAFFERVEHIRSAVVIINKEEIMASIYIPQPGFSQAIYAESCKVANDIFGATKTDHIPLFITVKGPLPSPRPMRSQLCRMQRGMTWRPILNLDDQVRVNDERRAAFGHTAREVWRKTRGDTDALNELPQNLAKGVYKSGCVRGQRRGKLSYNLPEEYECLTTLKKQMDMLKDPIRKRKVSSKVAHERRRLLRVDMARLMDHQASLQSFSWSEKRQSVGIDTDVLERPTDHNLLQREAWGGELKRHFDDVDCEDSKEIEKMMEYVAAEQIDCALEPEAIDVFNSAVSIVEYEVPEVENVFCDIFVDGSLVDENSDKRDLRMGPKQKHDGRGKKQTKAHKGKKKKRHGTIPEELSSGGWAMAVADQYDRDNPDSGPRTIKLSGQLSQGRDKCDIVDSSSAELMAILRALMYVRFFYLAQNVAIWYDCSSAADAVRGLNVVTVTCELVDAAQAQLVALARAGTIVSFMHISARKGNTWNEYVDCLARTTAHDYERAGWRTYEIEDVKEDSIGFRIDVGGDDRERVVRPIGDLSQEMFGFAQKAIPWRDFICARAKMKGGTSPGSDGITAEGVRAIPLSLAFEVWALFILR